MSKAVKSLSGFNLRTLPVAELASAAWGGAAVLVGFVVGHASVGHVLSAAAAGGIFFLLSLTCLRYLSSRLYPFVLASALAGGAGGFSYWLLWRPGVTAIGALVLGAIGGALVSAFQLIYVHYRSDMLGIEERLDARLSQIDRAFTEDLATLDREQHSRTRLPPSE